MSVVVEDWERGECPIADGIYSSDDHYWPLELFEVIDRQSIVSPTTEMGKLLVESPIAEDARFQVYGGETAWEGCGYIALVDKPNRALVWLIHSSTGEPFRKARIESDAIIATSGAYPFSYRWRVPISMPSNLAVQKVD